MLNSDPPENIHFTVKKLPKFLAIFWQSNGNFPEGQVKFKGGNKHSIFSQIVDNEDFCEVHELHAKNVVIGLARMGGLSVGIVANQPNHLSGKNRVSSFSIIAFVVNRKKKKKYA